MIRNFQNTFKFFQKNQQLHQFYKFQSFATTADGKKSLNYYELLEVSKTSSQKDIKTSFLKLAKVYHPDVYKGSDTDRFRLVKEAYETLRKPAKRKQYDKQLREQDMASSVNYDDFEQDFEEGKEGNKKDGPMTGGFSFDGMKMDEKKKVNLQEEYKNFFEEPIHITPEQVVTHDDPYERQLGYEERVRYEYAHIRNNMELYTLKHLHQKGYQNSVQDTIDMMNAKNIPDEVLKAQMKKTEKKSDQYKKIALVVFLVVSIPFFISFYDRKKKIRDNLIKDSVDYLEYNKKVELVDVQDRMRFDHRFQEQATDNIEVDIKNYQWQKVAQ